MARSSLTVVGGVVVLVVLAAAAAFAGWTGTAAVRRPATTSSSVGPTPGAYRSAAATPTAGPSAATGGGPVAAQVAARLAAAVRQPALGDRVRAKVVDLATGAVLYDRGGSVPAAPASTAKLLTAAAVLAARGAGYRIPTVVRASGGGAVVLVGAGDPTLTGAAAGHAGAYSGAARISDLAAQLRRARVTPTRIVVDDSAFSGPTVSPYWAAEDVPSEYESAVTAVMTDGGRATPTSVGRSSTPDLDAGRQLAAALGHPGLRVSRGQGSGRVLATVRSAPVSTLVEQMLLASDDVIAECLARQVALAAHAQPSFTGAAAAIRSVLAKHRVEIGGGMVDGSGLAVRDRVSMNSLIGVLTLADRTPALRGLFAGLPVGGWSGTLGTRFRTTATRAGAGVVRAKTGTLTGVSALAGIVRDRSGATLAFAVDADRAPATASAEAALDVLATRLAGCGCR